MHRQGTGRQTRGRCRRGCTPSASSATFIRRSQASRIKKKPASPSRRRARRSPRAHSSCRYRRPGTHLDQLTDLDRAHELNPAHVRRHAVGAAPPGRAGVAGLVDPLHDRAAVNLSAEVDVGRLGQEAQRGCVLLAHAYSSLRTAIARFIAIVHLLEYVKLPNYPHQAFVVRKKSSNSLPHTLLSSDQT